MAINKRVRRISTDTEATSIENVWCCFRVNKRMILSIIGVALLSVAIIHRENRDEIVYLRKVLGKLSSEMPTLESMDSIKELIERAWRIQESLEKISNSNEIAKRAIFTLERPDLALLNSGGKIIGIGRETKLLNPCCWYQKLVGCPRQKNAPHKMLETSMYPGDCFGFYGQTATIYIQLIGPAIVDSVAIEHITKQMSPNGNVSDAPRVFSVYVSHNLLAKCYY